MLCRHRNCQIITAINYHFGEGLVRARFTEYVHRFIRLASRFEEDVTGTTTIGFPSATFSEGPGESSQLGSGIIFLDEAAGARELAMNASRIEGWRRTMTYQYFQEVRGMVFFPPPTLRNNSGWADPLWDSPDPV